MRRGARYRRPPSISPQSDALVRSPLEGLPSRAPEGRAIHYKGRCNVRESSWLLVHTLKRDQQGIFCSLRQHRPIRRARGMRRLRRRCWQARRDRACRGLDPGRQCGLEGGGLGRLVSPPRDPLRYLGASRIPGLEPGQHGARAERRGRRETLRPARAAGSQSRRETFRPAREAGSQSRAIFARGRGSEAAEPQRKKPVVVRLLFR